MTSRLRAVRRSARDDDEGISILETVMALTVFAIIVIGLVTSVGSGLRLTGRANGRQAASQLAVQSIEAYRTFAFDAIAMDGADPYESAPDSPDANVNTAATPDTFTVPLADGATEEIVDTPAGSVDHIEKTKVGGRKITTYRYVTWTTAAKTEKRLTVVATWPGEDVVNGGRNQVVLSSVFSPGKVEFPSTTLATGVTVTAGVPATLQVVSAGNFPTSVPFFVKIAGITFTVTAVSGTTWTATPGASGTIAAGTKVELSAGFGAPAATPTSSTTSSSTSTTTTIAAPASCPGDAVPPSVSAFDILKGSAAGTVEGFTSSNTLTVSISATDSCAPMGMELSTTGSFTGAWQPYASSTAVTTTGQGTKTVYARFKDANNNVSGIWQDSVIVDTIEPSPPPPKFKAVRDKKGADAGTNVDLQWDNDSSDVNFNGYVVYRRTGSSGPFVVQSLTPVCTTNICTVNQAGLTVGTGYTYYAVGIDKAGNESGQSVHGSI